MPNSPFMKMPGVLSPKGMLFRGQDTKESGRFTSRSACSENNRMALCLRVYGRFYSFSAGNSARVGSSEFGGSEFGVLHSEFCLHLAGLGRGLASHSLFKLNSRSFPQNVISDGHSDHPRQVATRCS